MSATASPPKPPLPSGPPPAASTLQLEVKKLEHQKEELAIEIEQELAALQEIRRAKAVLNESEDAMPLGDADPDGAGSTQHSPPGKPPPPTMEPQHQQGSMFEFSHSQYRDHPKLNSAAKAYILSDEEKVREQGPMSHASVNTYPLPQLKIKAVHQKKRQTAEQRKKTKIIFDFEKNLLTAHMAQKKTSSNVSLISLMCKATEVRMLHEQRRPYVLS